MFPKDAPCGIIYHQRTGERRLILYCGRDDNCAQFYSLTSSNPQWQGYTAAWSQNRYMKNVELSNYESYLMGGYSRKFDRNTR